MCKIPNTYSCKEELNLKSILHSSVIPLIIKVYVKVIEVVVNNFSEKNGVVERNQGCNF